MTSPTTSDDGPPAPDCSQPVYLSGLDLHGRRVLVVGAGRVASRRIPRLLEAGALVEVVAPQASEHVEALARQGRLAWHQRCATAQDIDGAWYVMVATADPEANEAISAAAQRARIFCVRADLASRGTAWTPATTRIGDFTVGVVGNRDPHGSMELRRRIVEALAETPPDAD
ncbi:hypothetical protein GCM10027030_15350 [Luteococcus sediminum]|uniref:precorrin-2 dehydrogenase/sirohydrochlorin ferrochelatase family protein n=1 Tax=Luteococcus sp. TaxID=1969402 RepID=UPI003735CB40